MGVKSTVTLSRADAVKLYVELKSKQTKRQLIGEAYGMDSVELEDMLEDLSESTGHDSFSNYVVIDDE